ncbi:hypothetical protein PN417_09865 [Halorubrum ezzemoulense]|jgi:hypothetical protein|uniref:hypothetical protein n=1 Tax=Halorubrum ezzemoulense TaxID=337243 RepID=UPI00232D6256|nr:hypothetical protein [Halorubrum ezzemoulense]MDB9301240.1 hypothetical protein [Halorubrum ezzemoulense]
MMGPAQGAATQELPTPPFDADAHLEELERAKQLAHSGRTEWDARLAARREEPTGGEVIDMLEDL